MRVCTENLFTSMALDKLVILLCVVRFAMCALNLTEGSSCITKGLNGTCVNIFKCNSAALTYLFVDAGFNLEEHRLPELPDICSQKDGEPVICCTDCDVGDEKYRHSAIGPYGEIISKEESSLSRDKCREYFRSLPYPCRFPNEFTSFTTRKIWREAEKCHKSQYRIDMIEASVGGRDAQRWEFPHVALIGYGKEVETAQWLCGGSVISERFILTAAHCTSTRTLGNITFAALGLLKRSDPKKYWKIYKIKRIIIHPEYKPPSKYHDIALLETEKEIVFGEDLLPACLDDGSQWIAFGQASGWGRLGHRQTLADTLQVVGLNEFSETVCAEIYKPHRHLVNGYDHEKQMCYGSNIEVVDTCEGDSGGPLHNAPIYKCMYNVIGVTSYGKDCGIFGSAGMYTRVSYYVPWIESIVWPEETKARKEKENEWLNRWLN